MNKPTKPYSVKGEFFKVYLCDECARTYHTPVLAIPPRRDDLKDQPCRECWKRAEAKHAPDERSVQP